jgi:hypothetical protein
MSLKAFHVLFITIASAMALGCGIWGLQGHFSSESGRFDLPLGIGGILAGLGLIAYEIHFLKKTKGESLI